MLKQKVVVTIDRPINSVHPEHSDIYYEVNYGYIEGTISEVDKEPIDAYVFGVDYPINSFEGEVIAIIHRENEEDKLIVSNQRFSKREIFMKTYFIERFFDSYIEMAYTSKDDILFDLENSGLQASDKLMIHSSLKSFGDIEGKDIIEAFKEYISDGLIIFPTHTWKYIQNDNDVFDVENTPSCVGMLTNIALKTEGFKRSLHPTHSVCAYGAKSEEYLNYDLNSNTPVSPNGCFGVLNKLEAQILFMGAPLSKNTFIHSIEEEMGVHDRFTEHIYHFITKNKEEKYDYYMPRHYSSLSEHISDNYEKLLPHFLVHGIARKIYIGNSKTYVVDAKKCYNYVKSLITNNRHIFDDNLDYED